MPPDIRIVKARYALTSLERSIIIFGKLRNGDPNKGGLS